MLSLNFWICRKKHSANVAKKRLQNILNKSKKEKNNNKSPLCYSSQFKNDLTKIVCQYMKKNIKIISIQLQKTKNNPDISELKIIFTKNIKQNFKKNSILTNFDN
ncbi:cell division topological specificity factor MinE [Blochmannia endosymbiont of Camponotus (Colobopsis) obliquus]|uniref:cell division topological specificity factor MinE n=1 Tax=Blochmannia endosymbiont of Camponotus (Colobopsis) obliquus TaxID=1505597 RepID=UPI00061A5A28|nr:cell division topological specificity factor MinE [Blochmannia endosymbiont of Camponotus (Colobopsis) obliquus]AKC60596.1 Cell division topological specificity factor [Blochmannia endosymbiont of Camponotus (Colobopsis) obliquus]